MPPALAVGGHTLITKFPLSRHANVNIWLLYACSMCKSLESVCRPILNSAAAEETPSLIARVPVELLATHVAGGETVSICASLLGLWMADIIVAGSYWVCVQVHCYFLLDLPAAAVLQRPREAYMPNPIRVFQFA